MEKLSKIIDDTITFVFLKHTTILSICFGLILVSIGIQTVTPKLDDYLVYLYVMCGVFILLIVIIVLVFSFIINNKDFN